MDLSKNYIPENIQSIHIIAICGTAMGALACMLKEKGYSVTGSDQKVYPPMSDFLVEKGIHLIEGFGRENLASKPDLVIVGNSVRKDNPEAIEIADGGYCYCSMPQAINKLFARDKVSFVVSGTHGKTTTSSLMAWVLYEAGLDPSFMIGGLLNNFNSNYRVGNGNYIILEGDEYDTAFFDKGAKFYHFDADVTVLTSVEFDHADIFDDLRHVKNVFRKFIAGLKPGNKLIACDSDKNIDDVIDEHTGDTLRYGFNDAAYWQATNVRTKSRQNTFDVFKGGEYYSSFQTSQPGMHNILNILSVIGAADHIGISKDVICKAVNSFKGVKRRQEVRGVKNGITVMDDFAHHPTAVLETTKALKSFYSSGRLIAVFEPRTNSSRRNIFQDVYPDSFEAADIILIPETPMLESIPSDERFSSRQLVEDLIKRKKQAVYFENTEAIISWLVDETKEGDLVLIMSNGGFDNIHERLLKLL